MERQQALEVALSQIEKQFGKGSIMRMGDKPDMAIETVSTGALALDIALGVGGLPRGRIVEIYGPEASGKCCTADTHVWTDRGLETVAEVFARCGQPARCTSRVTQVGDRGVRAVNEQGELEPIAALTHNNRRPVLRLQLQSGREVKVTANHPLRVVNERGFIVWREAGHIHPGDVVVSALFGAVEAASGDGLSEDEAVFLGYLVAEGSLRSSTQLRFTNCDHEVGGEFTRLAEQLFGATVKCYGEMQYAINSKVLRTQLAEQYGLDYVNAAGKTVPSCIRTGGHKIQRAFLSALFEGDGWIDTSSTVGLGTASEQLARQVQLLLYGLGIPCSVRPTFNKVYERNYWSVTINPASAHRFLEEVGFRSQRRQGQVAAHFRSSSYDPRFENVPLVRHLVGDLRDDIGGDREFDRIAGDLFRTDFDLACSRSRLERIVAWAEARSDRMSGSGRALLEYLRHLSTARYTYEPVVSVEDAGVQPTFDVVLPKTHSFLANGVVSHNTTLAMHVVAEAQRNGGICAYIDAEHAVDPIYARAIGVNVDDLLISQPDTGEQALEIADTLIRSGALDVVAIDSVAALTPRAEIEGEMGDTHVGLQARLMSQALRKLTANLNRTNTIALFINQLREKIGVMFGSPETTPGGRALKFYSSVRLDIRRIEAIKDGVEVVGNRTRVKVVKNKCLAAGTKVFDPTTGVTHLIEDIVEKGEATTVVAADKLGKLHVRPIVQRFDQGEAEVIGLHLRDGTALWVTLDHKILTDKGWREARELVAGDAVARPRRAFGFGEAESVPPDHARMLGYLIGDGYVGGKTPIVFINTQESLQKDAAAIASTLGCDPHVRGIDTAFSHRKGEKNRLLELTRSAGIWGHLAPTKQIPASFFSSDTSAEVVANLLFGIWETDGYVSREQTGGIRLGFTTTSEQLAHQLHWLLLRFGIGSSVRSYNPKNSRPSIVKGRKVQGKFPCWETRVSGIDNVERFANAIPTWGPRGQRLTAELAKDDVSRRRGSQRGYLPANQSEPVLSYLRGRGVTPQLAASLIGDDAGNPVGGLKQVLGVSRLRRDRLERLADALDSEFLRHVLDEDVWYDRIVSVSSPEWRPIYDIEVGEDHTFVANDVVVSNCASPFRQAEFDITYGKGISREGSLIDVGVDLGLVKKSGAWFTYEGEQLGQGRENAKAFLAENLEVMVEISERIRQAAGLAPPSDSPAPADADADAKADADDQPITLD